MNDFIILGDKKSQASNLKPKNYQEALVDSMVDSLHETADYLKQKFDANSNDIREIYEDLELHRSWAESDDERFEKIEDELKSLKKEASFKSTLHFLGRYSGLLEFP